MKENEQQFTDIVRRNRSTIYTVCYMFSKDNDEVADMFQEVLIRLWNGMESFYGRSNIKTWIYRVALNTCITIDKRKKRNHKAQLSMDVDYFNSREVKSRTGSVSASTHKPPATSRPCNSVVMARRHQLRRNCCYHRHYTKECFCQIGAHP